LEDEEILRLDVDAELLEFGEVFVAADGLSVDFVVGR
jgi:hypothetical protein